MARIADWLADVADREYLLAAEAGSRFDYLAMARHQARMVVAVGALAVCGALRERLGRVQS